jgi:hypothetical protein
LQKLDLINGPVSYPGVAEVRPGNDGGLLFSRLPQADRYLHAEMMRYIVRVTSGVRAAFRTDASTLVVGAETNVFRMNAVDEATSIDVLVDGVVSASVRSADGWWEFSLPGRIAEIEVWLPHDAASAVRRRHPTQRGLRSLHHSGAGVSRASGLADNAISILTWLDTSPRPRPIESV